MCQAGHSLRVLSKWNKKMSKYWTCQQQMLAAVGMVSKDIDILIQQISGDY
jgi:hypothetical protein